MFNLATFIPASASFHIISLVSVDGPIVQTIFVLRLTMGFDHLPFLTTSDLMCVFRCDGNNLGGGSPSGDAKNTTAAAVANRAIGSNTRKFEDLLINLIANKRSVKQLCSHYLSHRCCLKI
ncbi:hypothetical protein HanPSC8_Chr07g0306141 [Helianthus annuus]|nr:hypothetical protein HanPSC8_Chr07g0306141 [Helianthus annuus]